MGKSIDQLHIGQPISSFHWKESSRTIDRRQAQSTGTALSKREIIEFGTIRVETPSIVADHFWLAARDARHPPRQFTGEELQYLGAEIGFFSVLHQLDSKTRISSRSSTSSKREVGYALTTIETSLYRCDRFLWSLQTGADRPDSGPDRILVESTSIGEMFEVRSGV
jgi:hypothetical protein